MKKGRKENAAQEEEFDEIGAKNAEKARKASGKTGKSTSVGSKLLIFGVCALLLAYFGIQIFAYFANPLVTAAAYRYTVEDAIPVFGYVVREEEILQAPSGGVLSLARDEGERVGAGGKIATVYRDEAALARQTEMETLEEKLAQLRYAQESANASEVSLKLDSEIATRLLVLQGKLAGDELASSTDSHINSLRTLILKRDYTYSGTSDLDAQIGEIKAQLKAMKAAGAASLTPIKAAKSGIYSAVVDGYETLLTPALLPTLSPSALLALQPLPAPEQGVGKLIYGNRWSFVTVMDAQSAQKFKPGDSTSLRFAKGFEEALQVRVSSVSAEENKQCVVAFSSEKYLSRLTLLRKQSADIVESSVTGLRVPQNALRVLDGQSGVYCVVGMNARFKPVQLLYRGDGFCLIEAASQNTGDRLREGDQVIITAKDLYEGKVVG